MNTDHPLDAMNSMGLPSVADAFARFQSLDELQALARWAETNEMPITVLGGGSNVLLSPRIQGLVIQSNACFIKVLGTSPAIGAEKRVLVEVGAGKQWHEWVCDSVRIGHGLENLALIPGSVGASPIQNIGAYGVEVGEYIAAVVGYQISTGQIRRLDGADCRFGYRDSVFKRELNNDFVVTSVIFSLKRAFSPCLEYGPLSQWHRECEQEGVSITPDALIEQVCAIRSSRLPDPADIPNSGSFFKNPVVPIELAEKLAGQFSHMPSYSVADQKCRKLAAGWLIDQAGWKGKSMGKAKMHDRQALVLTVSPGASLNDVLMLQQAVGQSVLEKFGVQLEPEPVLLA